MTLFKFAIIAGALLALIFLITRPKLILFLGYLLVAGSIGYFVISVFAFFPAVIDTKVFRPPYGHYKLDEGIEQDYGKQDRIKIITAPTEEYKSKTYTWLWSRSTKTVVDTLVPEDNPIYDINTNPLYWQVHNIDINTNRFGRYNESEDPMFFTRHQLNRVLDDARFKDADKERQMSILSRFFDQYIDEVLRGKEISSQSEMEKIKYTWVEKTYRQKVLREVPQRKLVPQKTITIISPDKSRFFNRIWATIILFILGIGIIEVYNAIRKRNTSLVNKKNKV